MSQISRVTTWASGQILKAADLNGEFNNIVNAWNNIDTASASWQAQSISGNLSIGGTLTLTGNAVSSFVFNPGSNQAVRINKQTFANAGGVIEFARPGDGSYQGVIGIGPDANDDLTVANASGSSFLRLGANNTIGFYIGETLANLMSSARPSTTIYAKLTTAGLGFSNSAGIVGTATNDSASTGNVGEYVVSTVSSYGNMASTGTFGNVTSITLGAGDWDVVGQTVFNTNGATTSDGAATAVSINSGNTTTDHVKGVNVLYSFFGAVSNAASSSVVYRLSLSGSTIVYLKAMAPYSGGPPQVLGTIYGRRRR